MGFILLDKFSNFSSNAVAFNPPVTRGAEYWNFFGGTDETLTRNLIAGKPGSEIVNPGPGTISSGDYYAIFPDNNEAKIKTGITPVGSELTIIAVGASAISTTDTNNIFASNYVSTGQSRTTLSLTTTGDRFEIYGENSSGTLALQRLSQAGATPTNTNRWSAGVFNAAGLKLYNATTPTGASLTPPVGITTHVGNTPIYIGGNSLGVSASFHSMRIYMIAIYSVALTADEVATISSYLTAYYQRRGVTI